MGEFWLSIVRSAFSSWWDSVASLEGALAVAVFLLAVFGFPLRRLVKSEWRDRLAERLRTRWRWVAWAVGLSLLWFILVETHTSFEELEADQREIVVELSSANQELRVEAEETRPDLQLVMPRAEIDLERGLAFVDIRNHGHRIAAEAWVYFEPLVYKKARARPMIEASRIYDLAPGESQNAQFRLMVWGDDRKPLFGRDDWATDGGYIHFALYACHRFLNRDYFTAQHLVSCSLSKDKCTYRSVREPKKDISCLDPRAERVMVVESPLPINWR